MSDFRFYVAMTLAFLAFDAGPRQEDVFDTLFFFLFGAGWFGYCTLDRWVAFKELIGRRRQ